MFAFLYYNVPLSGSQVEFGAGQCEGPLQSRTMH